jgi:hypothetical protein
MIGMRLCDTFRPLADLDKTETSVYEALSYKCRTRQKLVYEALSY